ncbi:MAG: flagellar motor switch phosphatase FliY [Lachnospiraceae bacterium]|nr:flagellar motor switch phosphatase FliY [Lachnospiraceae bacterium]
MDGMLSQEEINALLSGMDTFDTSSDDASSNTITDIEWLTDMEQDTMGEVSNISMGTAATTLSSLVNQKVDITTPSVQLSSWNNLVESYGRPCVFLQISYKEGLYGNNILILQEKDVKVITDLMMGGDGTNAEGEITDLHLSAISEAMNQMMGSASTSISSMLNTKIDISPPNASLVDLNEGIERLNVAEFLEGNFVKIAFEMKIGDLVDSEIMQLYPIDFCRTLCKKFLGDTEEVAASAPSPQPSVTEHVSQTPVQTPVQTPPPAMGQPGMAPQGMMPEQMAPQGMPFGYGMPNMGYPPQGMPMMNMNPYVGGVYGGQPEVNVQSAQFQPFSPDIVALNQRENINLIMDVPLEVTVELGRTRKSIQDILEFSPGTIIELEKLAGEPIDVLVNGKFVAKGEVVVIEESFGVRVTEIIK